MAADEIRAIINKDKYNEIKNMDQSPLFKAFVLGHEGISKGRMVKYGNVLKRWLRSAVEKLHSAIKIGTQVFYNHGLDNSHENRQPIGEIVGKAVNEIDGKLRTIGVVYINPQNRGQRVDIASIETDDGFTVDIENGNVLNVGNITGVALGDSEKMKPGFSGATLQGALQEMASKLPDTGNAGVNKMEFTDDEIIQEIKKRKLKPDVVFNRDELEKLEWVIGLRKSKERLNGAFEKKQSDFDRIEELRAEWEKEKKEKEDALKSKESIIAKYEARSKIDNILKDERRGLDDKKKDYILKGWDNFTVKEPEKIDDEINKFVDTRLDAYKEHLKFFGLEKQEGKNPDGDDITPGVNDPKKNPLIPENADYL